MRFLLDTNVISELRKLRPHGAVLAWYSSIQIADIAFPSVAIYELQAGAEITRRQDPARAVELELWIDRITRETPVLPLDYTAAREAARLLDRQSPILLEDGMIAAIAKVNRLTVATRNTRDFMKFGVPLINPFEHR